MKLIIFLVLCVSRVFAQDISCIYELGFNGTTSYVCHMTINNPNGFDDFTGIAGEHVSGWTDSSVSDVIIASGVTTNIPRIICQRFPQLWRFNAANFPVGIQSLTETSFSGCMSLQSIRLHGEITSIHPSVFMNNFNLRRIELGLVLMTSIPREVLGFSVDFFGISAPLLNDLPADFFSNAMSLQEVELRATGLQEFRQQWFQGRRLRSLRLSGSAGITSIPRNSFNGNSLTELRLDMTSIQQLDLSSFELLESLQLIDLSDTTIEAFDFNIIDRASLRVFRATGMRCASFSTENFSENRQQFLNVLEPCFAAFDARFLSFSSSNNAEIVNSLRRERIVVGVQASSDACVNIAMLNGWNPSIEVCFGMDGNSRSELREDGRVVLSRSTPGILNSGRLEEFEITWQNNMVVISQAGQSPPLFVHPLAWPINARFITVRQTTAMNASWTIRQLVN